MKVKPFLFLGLALSMITAPALAQAPAVVTTIKPVHALVAQVMNNVGTPYLLIEGAASPHTYAMTPSDAAAVQDADVLFWVGAELEVFLTDPIETLAADAAVVTLSDTQGLVVLPFRDGGAFEDHVHEDDHAGHKHEDEHDHDHEDSHAHDHDEHGHDEDAHHDHGGVDMHLWLDPANAKAMVGAIAAALIAADPANEMTYKENAEATLAKLDELESDIAAKLAPVQSKPFIVFHDAYQYFERRFGLQAVGSITVSPEILPGAARIAEMQARVRDTGATCVFAEPQFEPRLVETVIEGTDAKSGVLDPLGAEIEAGPDAYANLIEAMAQSFVDCLEPGAR